MQPSLDLILTVVAVVLILRLIFRRSGRRRGPRPGEGGQHSKRELRRIVNHVILPVFDRPEQDSLEYSTGGLLGRRDLPIIQRELGRDFDASFRRDAPGVLVVVRRQRRW